MPDRQPIACPNCGASVRVPEGYLQVECPNCHTRTKLDAEGRIPTPPPNEPDWLKLHADLKAVRSYVGWLLAITIVVILANAIGSFIVAGQLHDLFCSVDPSSCV